MDKKDLQKLIPSVNTDLITEIVMESQFMEFDAEVQLMDIGSFVHSVPLVLNGSIRVIRREEEKELLLYHIHPGELCIMSFAACYNNTASRIIAITNEPSALALLPESFLKKWLQTYPSFSNLIFNLYQNRYLDLIDTIDQLIFHKLDERLSAYLHEKSRKGNSNSLTITHQQIAKDLGTAREVISRLMKKLEKEGRVEQGRNLVIVVK